MSTSPAFHDPDARRLHWRTTNEVAAIPKDRALVVQPIAAVEQHGAHLPLYTDSLVAEAITRAAVERTPRNVEVWTLPTQAYGKSNEHAGFAGTIWLRAETLIAVCTDIGRSVAASGFKKLAFVNGHGGQPGLLEMVARDIRAESGLEVYPLSVSAFGLPEGVVSSASEATYGVHAGELETSLVMALAPDAVRRDQIRPGSSRAADLFTPLRFLTLEDASPVAWLTRDLAPDGVLGDPTKASAEAGRRLVEHWAGALAGAFGEICAFSF